MMANVPARLPSTKLARLYVFAVLASMGGATVFTTAVLFLRPNYDPLVIIGATFGISTSCLAGILAYLKSQETHLSVNSRLDAWMAANAKSAVEDERKRVADKEKI